MFYLLSLLGIEFILLCRLVYYNEKWWGATTLIITFAIYNLFFDQNTYINWWHWIYNNPVKLVEYIIVWLVLGVVWSFFKWYLFLKENRKSSLNSYHMQKGQFDMIYIPKASDNSTRIITWMMYWPISILLYVCGDWILNLYTKLFNAVSGVYNKIGNSVYSEEIAAQQEKEKK